MIEGKLKSISDVLAVAEETRTPIDPLSSQYPDLTLENAYQIQLHGAGRRLQTGDRLVGYKVGLTSAEAQKHFGVFEPDFGHLFDSMLVPEEGEIDVSGLIQPKIEGELAFLVGSEIRGPGLVVSDLLSKLDGVMGALEIIDSRIRDWKIKAVDTISDNGSSARVVLSSHIRKLSENNLPFIGMALSRNGEVETTGAGAAVLGNPLNAVLFIANEVGKLGRSLVPGQIILSGAMSQMLPLRAGENYSASFKDLGRVRVRGVSK